MRLLVIDDEQDIIDFLKPGLEAEGFVVDVAMDGERGVYLAKTNDYDVVIVDNMLPKKSGFSVCSEMRQADRTMPILVLSVVGDAAKKADLLNAGADDYLTKPFSFEELTARIRALMRRPRHIKTEMLELDGLLLDSVRHIVTRDGRPVRLTPKEFNLLEYLMRNQGTVVSRAMLLEHVWDMDADFFSNTIEAHILSLRRKLNLPGERPLIHTIHGIGYKLDVER